jgi:hypothetical protein
MRDLGLTWLVLSGGLEWSERWLSANDRSGKLNVEIGDCRLLNDASSNF